MGGESNTEHLINALRSLIVDIFWNTILVKEFSKEAILLHIDLDILNSFFAIPVKAKNDIVRLSMSIAKGPTARHQQKTFSFHPFYLEVTVGQDPIMSII